MGDLTVKQKQGASG